MAKRAIIVGATSGIGRGVAEGLLREGWAIGVAGRREAELERLREEAPDRVTIQALDVTADDAAAKLLSLIERTGGMDLFFLAAGVGRQNPELDASIELWTGETNVLGFMRMTTAAYRYFRGKGGHIAVISSIAGTKGLGAAPAYSATKRFQNTYIDALAQHSRLQRDNIVFTDIRPGFVDTALLDHGKKYPMLMEPDRVARSILRALRRRRRTVVIDRRYRVLVFLWRLVPQWIWERLPIRN